MENLESNIEKKKKFMQGWGFILLIIVVVTVSLLGLKAIIS
jgi:hypothetical protein